MAYHQFVFLILWAGACGYAAWRGGAPERIAAAAILLAATGTRWADELVAPYESVVGGVLLIDLVLLGILLWLALASTRFWPMLMTSMHMCGLLGHLSKPLGPEIIPKAYYASVAFWGFPVVLLLAVATWRHRRRLARYGVDYAWTRDLPDSYRAGGSARPK
ncbi:hypothetical protein [uncultured Sphingomonas sp.]|uniref:hypothetical protein n=1 Tax=uncultured Sphingomonas sp. TaxID=158754 RepID=UPI0025F9CAB0|nr:hypothetical protein [uncultured Sphingomonas sp.]